MSDRTGAAKVQEEPQEERGAMGSRDTGSDKPSGGPVDRPAGKADEKADTSVKPRKSSHPDAPDLQSGGG
ncbi:hypothetical protein ACPXCP_09495 [Streptomyces sp. DT20]|uniref:hypothetical protein n=1 Tax=unclassified Streptomyces TaxID=2593676 RepID=UPI00093CBF14|nr:MULTISPECIES: hypothetical protein [unclassified Streptomyces]OKK23531.1 hypothetical protein AMK09_09920 [Streptomyces sp. CB02488]WRZ15442.1 hypothetical protein OG892_33975 [Streptomyces sp. NBC_00341]